MGHSTGRAITIHTVNAPAGAGKTHVGAEHSLDLAILDKPVCIAQPTKHLIDQTLTDLRAMAARRGVDVPVKAITSDHGSRNVLRDPVEHFKGARGGGVLLITQSAFLGLPYWHRADRWHLICDEIVAPYVSFPLDLPHTHPFVTSAIEVEEHDAMYGRVVVKDRARLEAIASNRGGDIMFAPLQAAVRHLLSPAFEFRVALAQYERLLDKRDAEGRLHLFGLLSPGKFDGFASATVMGACFDESLLAHLWAEKVDFRPHRKLQRALRYQAHQNGGRLTIAYGTARPWSKRVRDREIGVDGATKTVLQDLAERGVASFDGRPYVAMANKDVGDDVFGDDLAEGRAVRLSGSPHGLNAYRHYHNALIVSALNPSPADFRFLETLNVDAEEVRTGLYRQAVYQGAMRISLRDLAATEPCRVVVADRDTAEWMAGKFPGAKVEALPGAENVPARGRPGRPRVHATSAEAKTAHTARRKARLTSHPRVLNGPSCPTEDTFAHEVEVWNDMRKGTGAAPGNIPDFRSPEGLCFQEIAGTGCAGKYGYPAAWPAWEGEDLFVAALRGCWAETVRAKEEATMYCPAIFDPNVPFRDDVREDDRTERGYANILAVRGLWFDFDGGELDHVEFARLLPRRRIVAFNTHSSTPSEVRWRAYIPTSGLMSVEVHRDIVAQIVRVLNRNGWWGAKQLREKPGIEGGRNHGLDTGKLAATSIFYLPAQAAHPQGSFFVDHKGGKRSAVDVFHEIDRGIVHERPMPATPREAGVLFGPTPGGRVPATPNTFYTMPALRTRPMEEEAATVDHARKVDKAVQAWRASQVIHGNGNTCFYRLAMALARAEMPSSDIEWMLNTEAWNARSPAKRRREISRIPLAKSGCTSAHGTGGPADPGFASVRAGRRGLRGWPGEFANGVLQVDAGGPAELPGPGLTRRGGLAPHDPPRYSASAVADAPLLRRPGTARVSCQTPRAPASARESSV